MTSTGSSGDVPDLEAILAAVNELLRGGDVTEARFRRVVADHQDLLTDEAEALIQGLALLQEAPQGREVVEQLGKLLKRTRAVGIDEALAEHREVEVRTHQEQRLDQERQQFRQWRQRKTRWPVGGGSLLSLTSCIEQIKESFRQDTITVMAHDVVEPSESKISAEFPKYVFRGESGDFPTTRPNLDRLLSDPSVVGRALEHILRVTIRVRMGLQEGLKISYLEALGYLQHYGMPTRLIDVTSNPDIAASFASSLRVGERGRVLVAPVERLASSAILVDLRGHPLAERPRRQSAFALTSGMQEGTSDTGSVKDLKDPQTIEQLGLEWLSFEFSDADAESFEPDPLLLDAHSDPAAGLIQLLIDDQGKMDDAAAAWLSERLQPAPFVLAPLQAEGEGSRFKLISADEAGTASYKGASKQSNYESWSENFSRPIADEAAIPEELLMKPSELAHADPGSQLFVMSFRGLQAFLPDLDIEP